MITVHSRVYIQGVDKWDFTFKGVHADTKPLIEYMGDSIAVNSLMVELDTADIYYYDGSETDLVDAEITNFFKPDGANFYMSLLLPSDISDNTIIVDWDGARYLCHKEIVSEGVWTYGDSFNNGNPTFTNYPFVLYFKPSDYDVARAVAKQTSGSIDLKIIRPSGQWLKFGG